MGIDIKKYKERGEMVEKDKKGRMIENKQITEQKMRKVEKIT
jgi:hypothetical protein